MDDATKRYDSEIAIRGVVVAVVGLVVVVAVSMLLMSLMLAGYQRRATETDPPAPAMSEAREPSLPPSPRLQASPPVDLGTMRMQERFLLENYGWVDRGAGIARIPIGKAMEIIAARGLPVREEPRASAPVPGAPAPPLAAPGAAPAQGAP